MDEPRTLTHERFDVDVDPDVDRDVDCDVDRDVDVVSPVRAHVVRGADRRGSFSWRSQLQILVPLFVVWLGGFGVLGAVVAHGNFGDLFLDPAYINGGAWYDGLISQLGVVAWAVAAVSAAWSAWIAEVSGRRSAALFLACGAVVGSILLVDDLFGFHALLPSFGVPKPIAEAMFLLPLVAWLLRFWNDIARTRYPILLAALGANGVSVVVDLLVHPGNADRAVLYEDGPKFLGILAWATYFVLTTRDIARSAMAKRPGPLLPIDGESTRSGLAVPGRAGSGSAGSGPLVPIDGEPVGSDRVPLDALHTAGAIGLPPI